ncbi:unnamed protein product [Acanthoscelides obtectus]|uniref:Uncharacterized protein n=1 Tax=Acanthoscelides obtectus TaxID=200917 RepID=A0A9P0LLJ2_ACAOB|nr:unnamed protein product [Acanthoscelides obtectus]CAK1679520.1 hypothetical protein AOBTE_LOCUS32319 [Acanthoscelides obtectus]
MYLEVMIKSFMSFLTPILPPAIYRWRHRSLIKQRSGASTAVGFNVSHIVSAVMGSLSGTNRSLGLAGNLAYKEDGGSTVLHPKSTVRGSRVCRVGTLPSGSFKANFIPSSPLHLPTSQFEWCPSYRALSSTVIVSSFSSHLAQAVRAKK